MTNTDKQKKEWWEEELKAMLNNPHTGLKDSSNTNKNRYAILALVQHVAAAEREKAIKECMEVLEEMNNHNTMMDCTCIALDALQPLLPNPSNQ